MPWKSRKKKIVVVSETYTSMSDSSLRVMSPRVASDSEQEVSPRSERRPSSRERRGSKDERSPRESKREEAPKLQGILKATSLSVRNSLQSPRSTPKTPKDEATNILTFAGKCWILYLPIKSFILCLCCIQCG